MKQQLGILFSKYGTIKDIMCLSSLKRRGQAFIIFEDVESASRAINDLQGAMLNQKPMVCYIIFF